MAWDDGLVGTARNIAATPDSPLRVMAGPGTGKSFAMKRRVARLLEGGQAARRILAVTFTRNAAAILQEQRRLFYVALTRCTEILVVSSATQMARNFAWKIGARVVPGSSQYARTVASQFLDELGPSAPVAIPGANWQY